MASTKRDEIFLSVLESLTSQDCQDHLEAAIRVLDVMAGNMKQELISDKNRQEALCNKILLMMINQNMAGRRLYAKFKLARQCKFELEPGVTRGLVMLLANTKNNMVREATAVYQAGVNGAVYCPQPYKRPLSLNLNSSLTMEELTVILMDFFRRMKDLYSTLDQTQSFSVFVNLTEVTVPDYGVTVLSRVR